MLREREKTESPDDPKSLCSTLIGRIDVFRAEWVRVTVVPKPRGGHSRLGTTPFLIRNHQAPREF